MQKLEEQAEGHKIEFTADPVSAIKKDNPCYKLRHIESA